MKLPHEVMNIVSYHRRLLLWIKLPQEVTIKAEVTTGGYYKVTSRDYVNCFNVTTEGYC